MLAIVADPPYPGYCLNARAAGAGDNLRTATGGAFSRRAFRFPAVLDVLLIAAIISHHRLPYPFAA